MYQMENKVVLVTSSSKGIGLACALKFAEYGACVYMGVRRVEDTQKICDSYKENKYKMFPVFFDAAKKDSYSSMVEETIRLAGRIDILINNFGTGNPKMDKDLVNGSEESFFEILDLNLGSVYRITKLVIPYMIKQKKGSIINISSVGGMIPDITRIGYGVSKSAINNITQQIAMQYARSNIRCNAILPGLTATDAALQNMPESFIQSYLSHVPLNRMGKPEDIANAAAFLASDEAGYITGHILDVAGGYGIGTPQFADMIRQSTPSATLV